MRGLCDRFATAPTRDVLETGLVTDHKSCSAIVDQFALAQSLRNACHARPMYTKYAGDMFMRQFELFTSAPLLKRQQPAAEPLLDRMKRVANYALRQLLDLAVYIVMKDPLKSRIRHDLAFDDVAADRQCRTRNTYLHAVGGTA